MDVAYLNEFTASISSSSWYNSTTNSFYNSKGVYASPVINLAGWGELTSNLPSQITSNDVWSITTSSIAQFGWPYDTNAIYMTILHPNVAYVLDGLLAFDNS